MVFARGLHFKTRSTVDSNNPPDVCQQIPLRMWDAYGQTFNMALVHAPGHSCWLTGDTVVRYRVHWFGVQTRPNDPYPWSFNHVRLAKSQQLQLTKSTQSNWINIIQHLDGRMLVLVAQQVACGSICGRHVRTSVEQTSDILTFVLARGSSTLLFGHDLFWNCKIGWSGQGLTWMQPKVDWRTLPVGRSCLAWGSFFLLGIQ